MIFDTFKDTIFLKESSNLETKLNALTRLIQEYPNNDGLNEEMFIIKKGLEGEKEIEYQLKKSNLGLYVLHDINIEYEGLKAQIDYIVITKLYIYFLECKNLIGNITINDRGDFIREYTYNDKRIKKGMYSPLRQAEAQRDVYKKIWNNNLSQNKIINQLKRMMSEDNFKKYHRVLVVAANNETILNTKYAPSEVKNKVIKSDALIRELEKELDNSDKDLWENKKSMERSANFFLSINVKDDTDYYSYYKDKYITNEKNKECLKDKLVEFRRKRSKEMQIPAFYVFNDEELEKIVETMPKSIKELDNILPPIKIKTHGYQIIEVLKQ